MGREDFVFASGLTLDVFPCVDIGLRFAFVRMLVTSQLKCGPSKKNHPGAECQKERAGNEVFDKFNAFGGHAGTNRLALEDAKCPNRSGLSLKHIIRL